MEWREGERLWNSQRGRRKRTRRGFGEEGEAQWEQGEEDGSERASDFPTLEINMSDLSWYYHISTHDQHMTSSNAYSTLTVSNIPHLPFFLLTHIHFTGATSTAVFDWFTASLRPDAPQTAAVHALYALGITLGLDTSHTLGRFEKTLR